MRPLKRRRKEKKRKEKKRKEKKRKEKKRKEKKKEKKNALRSLPVTSQQAILSTYSKYFLDPPQKKIRFFFAFPIKIQSQPCLIQDLNWSKETNS